MGYIREINFVVSEVGLVYGTPEMIDVKYIWETEDQLQLKNAK